MSQPEEEVKLENGEEPTGDARDPSGFLSEIIGADVTVKLNSGLVYKGAYSLILLFFGSCALPTLRPTDGSSTTQPLSMRFFLD
jgi:hypothetical protein